jgi:hypothetical protein
MQVRFIGAELLARPYPEGRAPPPPLHQALPQLYSLQMEGPRFQVYRLALAPGARLQPHTWAFSGALFVAKPMSLLSFEERPGELERRREQEEQPEQQGSRTGAGSSPDGSQNGLLPSHRHLELADAVWFDGPVETGAAVNSSGEEFCAFVVEWL